MGNWEDRRELVRVSIGECGNQNALRSVQLQRSSEHVGTFILMSEPPSIIRAGVTGLVFYCFLLLPNSPIMEPGVSQQCFVFPKLPEHGPEITS